MASFPASTLKPNITSLSSLSPNLLDFKMAVLPLGHLGSLRQLGMIILLLLPVWYAVSGFLAWFRLRKFPAASWLANFSYLWLAKTTYSGRQYWVHRELNRKHKLVRIGPNELLTDDPDIIRKISSARSGYERDSWYITGRFNPYHDNMFTVLQPAEHTKFKSRTLHAYSGREIPDLEIGVNQQVATLLRVMRENYARKGRSLDLGQLSCYFTMDVITRLAFGYEFGYLASETDHYNFLKGVRDLWPQMSTSADIPWIRNVLFSKPFLRLLGPGPKDKKGFGALMAVAEHHVSKRFEPGAEQKKDMLGSFIHHKLNQKECEVEGLFMVVAGTESTASAIRSVLVHTMTTPGVYGKLQAEIQAALNAGRASTPITVEQAKKLPYLQAVIYEGIRMRPPLLGLLPKVVPAGGDTFYGQHVPAGTAVCMNTSSLLRSKNMFGEDAGIFRPERFMELGNEARSTMERNVELIFGYGQWQCVGKTIAFMELNKSIFEVLRNFDLQLVSPAKPCDVLSYGVFLEENLFVKVTERHTVPSAV
ncbi:hypothetical protein DL766_003474 [Monosporascus sp. MC13-8B]|uniref:Ig-like domain-containing protein n=1 Tax=Monosporascus cannonballus TaxID=155416 RepID=A0ABY0HFL7_9PEZI|nr:hypothetical protein DL763_008396 [Monosporascus cannonballus]RYO91517.1 hypothetical protein DL762_002131 [Monosporascus cannonballus]RYP33411.1 hypothetical protein DL766_003474 [Monosporascus sp. MC13-8B]